ncbi:tautomerase [Halarchaeum sp. CBA1220]|uniref:tautomerase family protein n=1 Tax=Halarchaeum sp. CBA1220 TaxID=1853682 RepID=UPI000F3A8400|nr:tautomerase [Halarchaeum sp. CBA1220]QLC33054.1 tautomerase [Halarchaeum sp. CBA1220]
MPLLQFDTTLSLDATETEAFAAFVRETYAERMRTGTSHVAVTVREHDESALSIGRGVEGDLLFADAEVRRGRDDETKRDFALAVMEHVHEAYGVPTPNLKVVFTEHDGPSMMGYDRVGGEWTPEEG